MIIYEDRVLKIKSDMMITDFLDFWLTEIKDITKCLNNSSWKILQ